jgi:putative ABC transport system permease protein
LSRARRTLLVVAMAVSVACISGVRGAANVARSALVRESRAWLGGDLAVTTGESLDQQQIDDLSGIGPGVEWTAVTTTLTMGASDQSPDASLMAVKAVDPAYYPFYGALVLDPAQTLSAALHSDTVAVSRDALTRFHVRLGDSILVGGTNFRISAVIVSEPDRFSGVTALGVRCLLSRQAFERSGIARSGDSVKLRVLFRLPPGADVAAMGDRLRELFLAASVIDFHEANREAVSITEVTAMLLNVISFLALTLGAIGIAVAVRQHIEERARTLAVMKTIGGRNGQLIGLFVIQVAWLAALAFTAGFPLGWGIRILVLSLAVKYTSLPPFAFWDWAAARDTAVAGLAALTPTLVGTALAIVRLKPAILLRKDFDQAPLDGSRAIMGLAWGASWTLLGAIAASLLGSWNFAGVVIASLGVSVGLAFLLTHLLRAGSRRWAHAPVLRSTPLLRHGLANLFRPGNRGATLIVALAIGLMMTIATFQLNRAVTHSILETLPFDRPDFVLPGIEARLRGPVRLFLERQPGVENIEMGAQARGRLVVVNGPLVTSLVGCADPPLRDLAGLPVSSTKLEVAENLARPFGLHVGSRLQFKARGRVVSAIVFAVRPMNRAEEFWSAIRIDCGGLDPESLFFHVAVRIQPARIAAVRRAFIAEYPAIPVFTAEDLPDIVGDASHDAVLLARWVAWYALGSSVVVLMAMISATRGARGREIAILSALGARRRAVVKLYTIEFAAMGVFAGSIASVLACGFTAAIVAAIFRDIHPAVEWKSLVVATVTTGILSGASGWLPLHGLLRRKPMDVLRDE